MTGCAPTEPYKSVPQVDESRHPDNNRRVKSHLFISTGLLMAAIFFMRGMDALNEPGLGLREIYILGGFLVAGLLIHAGIKERKPR